MIEAKDFLGKDIQVGDKIVMMAIGYRNLVTGVVEKINPKKATIKLDKGDRWSGITYQFHNQVLVYEKGDLK